MPEPSLSWVEAAHKFVRGKRSLGASNKRTLPKGEAREERRTKASAAISEFDGKYYLTDDDESIEKWAAYARHAAKLGAGNCHAQATLAMFYLLHNEVLPLTLVGLEKPGDHEFLVAGWNKEKYGLINDMINDHLENWGAGVFICDPWANITCAAGDYKTKWQAKLEKWRDKGKELRDPYATEESKRWIDPCREDWYSAVTKHARKIDFWLPSNFPKKYVPDLTALGLS